MYMEDFAIHNVKQQRYVVKNLWTMNFLLINIAMLLLNLQICWYKNFDHIKRVDKELFLHREWTVRKLDVIGLTVIKS